MNLAKSNSNKIYFEDKDYLKKTLEQIQRDFNMSGLNFDDPKNPPKDYNELFSIVFENLVDLVRDNDLQLKNLLYRIDVSEISIQKRVVKTLNGELESILCNMIIERCLLKVLTREKFS